VKKRDESPFDRALREWAKRDPRTPADAAATRVVARLGRRPVVRFGWRLAATTAATALLLAVGLWAVLGDGEPRRGTAQPTVDTAGLVAPPLDSTVVLWWLDPETPVYFVLNHSESTGGGP
jgi:hypothetical protein